MNGTQRQGGWLSRGLKGIGMVLAVVMLITAMNPGSAEARRRHHGKRHMKTPAGKMMPYKPQLQTKKQA